MALIYPNNSAPRQQSTPPKSGVHIPEKWQMAIAGAVIAAVAAWAFLELSLSLPEGHTGFAAGDTKPSPQLAAISLYAVFTVILAPLVILWSRTAGFVYLVLHYILLIGILFYWI